MNRMIEIHKMMIPAVVLVQARYVGAISLVVPATVDGDE
jgi:hypothetical protein